ncbi:unnamed protein product, partial [Prorocentrum cordatum]
ASPLLTHGRLDGGLGPCAPSRSRSSLAARRRGLLRLLLGSSLSLAWLLGWTTPRSVPQASELASFDYGTLRPVTVEEKRQWKELGFVVLRGVIDPAFRPSTVSWSGSRTGCAPGRCGSVTFAK